MKTKNNEMTLGCKHAVWLKNKICCKRQPHKELINRVTGETEYFYQDGFTLTMVQTENPFRLCNEARNAEPCEGFEPNEENKK